MGPKRRPDGVSSDSRNHSLSMLQRLRLTTGLVLFSYVTSHLLNHSLGLISIQAAEPDAFGSRRCGGTR